MQPLSFKDFIENFVKTHQPYPFVDTKKLPKEYKNSNHIQCGPYKREDCFLITENESKQRIIFKRQFICFNNENLPNAYASLSFDMVRIKEINDSKRTHSKFPLNVGDIHILLGTKNNKIMLHNYYHRKLKADRAKTNLKTNYDIRAEANAELEKVETKISQFKILNYGFAKRNKVLDLPLIEIEMDGIPTLIDCKIIRTFSFDNDVYSQNLEQDYSSNQNQSTYCHSNYKFQLAFLLLLLGFYFYAFICEIN